MATFTGTNQDEIITPTTVSPSVTASPPGSKPGSGADQIFAGGGNDIVEAGGGDDFVDLGPGDDLFIWSIAGGHDNVNGQAGFDTVSITTGDSSDRIKIGSDENRALVEINNNGSVSAANVERIIVTPGIATDRIEISDLRATTVTEILIDLASVDTGNPDVSRDTVRINASDDNDTIKATADNGTIFITGFGPKVAIKNADQSGGTRDELTIKGFAGDDTLDLSALPDSVGMEFELDGGDGNDTLIGTAGGQSLFGGAGDDLLIGGAGADLIVGGLGIPETDSGMDTASYAASNAAVSVNLATGKGKGGHAEGDQLVEIENLIGSRFADTLTGDDKANRLDGRGGADTMAGGKGNDTYIVDNAGDRVIERAGEGIDTVRASISLTLAANVENLVLTGNAAIDATGNALANRLTGNAANNRLDGQAGADIMAGGKGDDTYIVDDIGDTVVEAANAGRDTVISSVAFTLPAHVENLVLVDPGNVAREPDTGATAAIGNALANRIKGNAADNLLAGKEGNDVLKGGGGSDSFLFDTALNGKTNVDTIKDFRKKEDKILLDLAIFTELDAGKLKKGAFYKAKKGKAKDGNDRIGYDKKSGALYYDADGRGGEKAVKFAVLDDGPGKLAAKDFLIVD